NANSPIMFSRFKYHQAQAMPNRTYDKDVFDKFFGLINVKNEDHKLLLKCYIIACFFPMLPKAILMPHGVHGSGKSTLQGMLKMIIDPSNVKALSFPRDIAELVQILSHHYFCEFDNVSYIAERISNELCKAVTGSGFTKRELY